MAFAPTTGGLKEASIFLIANTPGPVTQIPLSGRAYPAPSAAAVVSGTPAVGSALTCKTSHVSGALKYRWLRGGVPITGATGSHYVPTNTDYHRRLACRVTASNPVGSVTAKSPQTVPLAARNLANEPNSLVGQGSCRVASAPSIPGVRISGNAPATPASPLTFSSAKPVRVQLGSIDVRSKRVLITPRQLSTLRDGPNALTVNGKSRSLVLAPCRLSTSVTGSSSSQASYALSGAVGIRSGVIKTPSLTIKSGRGILGEATVFAHGQPQTQFPLTGRRTSSNGITVSLGPNSITVGGLPADTGTVRVDLRQGLVGGHTGTATAVAKLTGGVAAQALVKTIWR